MADGRDRPLHRVGPNEIWQARDGPLIMNRHDRYIERSISLLGEFSPGERKVFSSLVRPGGTVIDVGRCPDACTP